MWHCDLTHSQNHSAVIVPGKWGHLRIQCGWSVVNKISSLLTAPPPPPPPRDSGNSLNGEIISTVVVPWMFWSFCTRYRLCPVPSPYKKNPKKNPKVTDEGIVPCLFTSLGLEFPRSLASMSVWYPLYRFKDSIPQIKKFNSVYIWAIQLLV